jgi:cobalamin biosynthesis protein CobT
MAKKGMVVDFSDVEPGGGGGGGARVPEDDYQLRCVEIKSAESKSSGNPMLVWTLEISKGKHKGKKLKPTYTVLNANSLWKLMQVLEAMGIEVPKKKLDVLPLIKKAKGKECGGTVVDEAYEKDGKEKVSSTIAEFFDLETLNDSADEDEDDEDEDDTDDDDEDDDDEEEEEKPKKKAKKAKGKKKKSDDDDDDIEDLDLDEL